MKIDQKNRNQIMSLTPRWGKTPYVKRTFFSFPPSLYVVDGFWSDRFIFFFFVAVVGLYVVHRSLPLYGNSLHFSVWLACVPCVASLWNLHSNFIHVTLFVKSWCWEWDSSSVQSTFECHVTSLVSLLWIRGKLRIGLKEFGGVINGFPILHVSKGPHLS